MSLGTLVTEHLDMWNRDQASVIIPCHDQAHFLGEAIASVFAQTHRNYELIVVDDGSTDDTARVAHNFDRVRCLRQANRGVAGARNAGLQSSNGKYVVFLDADDRLLPNALKVGVNALEDRPEAAFVYGHVKLIAIDGSPLSTPRQDGVHEDHYLELLRHNYIWTTGAVVYRRSALESVGGFDASLTGSADFDLNARIARLFPICCSDTPVLEYRKHDEGMSRDYQLMLKDAVTARLKHRRFAKGRALIDSALHIGIRTAQEDYGEKLIEAVRKQLRQGDWRTAMSGLVILACYYPQGFLKTARRRLRSFALDPQS